MDCPRCDQSGQQLFWDDTRAVAAAIKVLHPEKNRILTQKVLAGTQEFAVCFANVAL